MYELIKVRSKHNVLFVVCNVSKVAQLAALLNGNSFENFEEVINDSGIDAFIPNLTYITTDPIKVTSFSYTYDGEKLSLVINGERFILITGKLSNSQVKNKIRQVIGEEGFEYHDDLV